MRLNTRSSGEGCGRGAKDGWGWGSKQQKQHPAYLHNFPSASFPHPNPFGDSLRYRRPTAGWGSFDVSPDGNYLAAGGAGGELFIFDIRRERLERKLSGHR